MEAQNFLFLGLKNGAKQPELLAQVISAFQNGNFVEQFKETKDSLDMLQLVSNEFGEVIK